MSLNPLRANLTQAGVSAASQNSAFQLEADAALAGFQSVRRDLERRVRQGELTVKVAREHAAGAATRLRDLLLPKADNFSPTSRAFLDRLIAATESRKAASERSSSESLLRETNRLLRQNLVEQQLASRVTEFEGRTFVRSMSGGVAAPSLDGLIRFHESASLAGDEAAKEWGRRQLEGIRSRVVGEEETRRIDAACDRPDALNPRIVAVYVENLQDASIEILETFVQEALATKDANACTAAFVLAREAPEGPSARWVRATLEGLEQFPDAALHNLRVWEAEARSEDARIARLKADYAVAVAEADARFPGLEAPTVAELERLERVQSRPIAAEDEPIGLALNRRGLLPHEVAASASL